MRAVDATEVQNSTFSISWHLAGRRHRHPRRHPCEDRRENVRVHVGVGVGVVEFQLYPTVEFWITRRHDLSRLSRIQVAKTPIYPVICSIPLVEALFDHNQHYRQTDRHYAFSISHHATLYSSVSR